MQLFQSTWLILMFSRASIRHAHMDQQVGGFFGYDVVFTPFGLYLVEGGEQVEGPSMCIIEFRHSKRL